MATLTLTFTAGSNAGASMRKLAKAIEACASNVPDINSTGASTVMTIDNGTGVATVQITGGPYTTGLYKV